MPDLGWAPHSAAQEAAEWRRFLTQLRDDLDHLVDEDPRSAGAARPPKLDREGDQRLMGLFLLAYEVCSPLLLVVWIVSRLGE